MTQRKPWTPEEDNILKHLKEELRISKWSTISQKMAEDFNIIGRTGKQCRERYHNHLDSNIVKTPWSHKEQLKLYELHDNIGNKWAVIAQDLPGRTDNCVKNHFYSKLRKSLRKLNKIIHDHFRKEFKQIKIAMLYKIIEANEERHKNDTMGDQEMFNSCRELKNRLLNLSDDSMFEQKQEHNQDETSLEVAKAIIQDIHDFSKVYKKQPKRARRPSQDNSYLKVEQQIRPRARTSINMAEQSEDEEQCEGSLFESEPSERLSKVENNSPEQQQVAQPKMTKSSECQTHVIESRNFCPRLTISSAHVEASKMAVENDQNGNVTNVETVVKNTGLVVVDNESSYPMISGMMKQGSAMSKRSNDFEQQLFFDDSEFQIKTFPFNPYGNVKNISMIEDNILEQQDCTPRNQA